MPTIRDLAKMRKHYGVTRELSSEEEIHREYKTPDLARQSQARSAEAIARSAEAID